MQNNFGRFFLPLLVTLGTLQPANAMFAPKVKTAKRMSFSKKDCKALIKQLEQEHNIPAGLLAAIGAVESEHTPYAVNCNGKSSMFTNHDAAISYVRSLRNKGIIDINIGVLQINYAYHQKRFKAEDFLDPYKNIPYAAKYLASLKRIHGSWEKAVKFYHSPVAKYQNMYFAKVMNALKRTDKQTYQLVSGIKSSGFKPARVTGKSAA
jgi:soluble lytic murein transglycosylase-like protein